MAIDINKAIEMVDGYMSQTDSLLKKSYREGMDEKKGLKTRLENFILTVFPDGKEKLANFRRSFGISVAIGGHEDTEEEKQADYISDLKIMRNNLVAYEEELQLKSSSGKKIGKLDELERETQERKAEADRRAAVVEGKLWGAVIELIDKLRDQLKERDNLNLEIVEMKKDIKDIKTALVEFSKKLDKLEHNNT